MDTESQNLIKINNIEYKFWNWKMILIVIVEFVLLSISIFNLVSIIGINTDNNQNTPNLNENLSTQDVNNLISKKIKEANLISEKK